SANELATCGPMTAVSSGPVTRMVDSTSAKLLAELNERSRRVVWWPFVGVLAALLFVGLVATEVRPWIIVVAGIVLSTSIVAAYVRDILQKSVVIMYDLDDPTREVFEVLFEQLLSFARCGATWHINSRAQVYDRKYHAGAGQLVDRNRIYVS